MWSTLIYFQGLAFRRLSNLLTSGWKVKDVGVGGVGFSQGLSPWLADNHLASVSSHGLFFMFALGVCMSKFPLFVRMSRIVLESTLMASSQLYHLFKGLCFAKLLQLCLTLCNPMDCSPPGSSVQGILQTRILDCRVFLQGFKGLSNTNTDQIRSDQLLSHVRLFATP